MQDRATSFIARFAGLLCLLALLTPASADATEQTGKIRGVVKNSEGVTLEDVEIIVQSDELQGQRTTHSGSNGSYWLPSLPPGSYDLRAVLDGYQTYLQHGIRVAIGSNMTVNVVLSTAEVSQTVTIVDERPVIDVGSSTTGAMLTKDHIDGLPVGRSYQSAARLTPGVTGGANPNVKGGSSRENKWLLDGANTTDPVTGTFSFNFNNDAIEEIQVITGNFRAENGGTLGGIVNVRTESGSNKFKSTLKVFYSNGNWSPRRDGVYTPDGRQIEGSEFDRDSQSFDLNVSIGGPVVRDRVWFFSSFRWIYGVSTALGARSPRVFQGFNMFNKLTVTPHPAHTIIISSTISPATISNLNQSQTVDPEAQRQQAQGNLTISGEWEWRISQFLKSKIKYNHFKMNVDVTPQPCTWRDDLRFKQCEDGQEEGYIDFFTPGRIGQSGARSTDNGYYYSLNDRWSDTLDGDVTLFVPRALGSHEIKLGASFGWTKSDYTFGYTGNIYYVDTLKDRSDPTSTVNYYWREGSGQINQVNRGSTIFGYLQDTWEPLPGLTVDLGLKYNRSTMRNDEGERIVGFDIFSPVAGISFDPTLQQKAKIFVGGGMSVDEGRLAISSFLDKNGTGRKLFLGDFFDRNTNYSYDQYDYSRSQSDYVLAKNVTAPRIYTVGAGFEALIAPGTRLSIDGTAKWFRNLWEDDEVNYIWNTSGTNTIAAINGIQSYFFRLRSPDLAKRNYYSMTFAIVRRMFKNLLLDINYTMSLTRGVTATQITAALDNPTQIEHEYGWLYSDRPHVVKASAAWRTPIGLQIAGTFTFQSGARFDRQYYGEKGGYALFVSERGTFDTIKAYWQLDLKFRYELKLPYGKLLVIAELGNITNNRQTTGISNGTLNARGEYYTTSRQPAMDMEFGLGYEF